MGVPLREIQYLFSAGDDDGDRRWIPEIIMKYDMVHLAECVRDA